MDLGEQLPNWAVLGIYQRGTPRRNRIRIETPTILIRPLTFVLLCITISILGCGVNDSTDNYELEGNLSSTEIPTSIEQAMEMLDALIPEPAKRKLLVCQQPGIHEACRDFLLYFQFQLERDIGNEWIRPRNSILRDKMIRDGFVNPEEMAAVIMSAYYRHLEGSIDSVP